MTRARFHKLHVLPWVLGALVLRAMIPMGFMPAHGTTLAAVMCSAAANATEQIEIPGTTAAMQCDYCLTPAFAVPPAPCALPALVPAADPPRSTNESLDSLFALIRAQSARAPPV